MNKIYYKKGYKYQLSKTYQCKIDIHPKKNIKTEYIQLTSLGRLTVKEGYAWDGPSGPTIDTKNFMRGSLIHDALYQLMRQQYLPELDRELADKELRKACLEDGMCRFRAWYVFKAVRKFAESSADPKDKKKIIEAP